MTRAVLSIGSNIDDRLGYLRRAVEQFRPWLEGVSQVYETPPWGPVEQQPFYNAVLSVDDPGAEPMEWLRRAQAAEAAADRRRDVHWGPRTLDVDVIVVGHTGADEISSLDPVLTLPHPYAAQRAFVLVPWLELDPSARLGGIPVAQLIAALDASDIRAVGAL